MTQCGRAGLLRVHLLAEKAKRLDRLIYKFGVGHTPAASLKVTPTAPWDRMASKCRSFP